MKQSKFSVAIFISTALSLSPVKCSAVEIEYNISTTSYHFIRSKQNGKNWNEVNPGFGLELSTSENTSLAVGTYKNSYSVQSTYLAIAYRPVKVGKVEAGMLGGVISGYEHSVFAAGTVKFHTTENTNIQLLVVPTLGKKSGFIGLLFGFNTN